MACGQWAAMTELIYPGAVGGDVGNLRTTFEAEQVEERSQAGLVGALTRPHQAADVVVGDDRAHATPGDAHPPTPRAQWPTPTA
jgi:hypothetical protein